MANASQIIIYQTEAGETKLEVRLENETVWLTQKLMAELFQTTPQNITMHLKNIFEEGEVEEVATCKDFLQVGKEGERLVERSQKFYNLDAIISVGYRIKSAVATRFRQWATKHIKEYIVKGFVLDDERLKNPNLPFDYFEELLKRIQDIRTSERRFYQKITDIYATSTDYDPTLETSILFFQTVQNKMHWAITGKTAAEIIAARADAEKPSMGLTSWSGGKVRKSDIATAKNYLNEDEITALNLLVEQFLAFAEAQAQQRKVMYMQDWIKRLNDILTINEREVLEHAGRIRKELAYEMAEKEWEKFKAQEQAIEKGESLNRLEADLKAIGKKKR